MGKTLYKNNVWISYESDYLKKKNHIQICLMGNQSLKGVQQLLLLLKNRPLL